MARLPYSWGREGEKAMPRDVEAIKLVGLGDRIAGIVVGAVMTPGTRADKEAVVTVTGVLLAAVQVMVEVLAGLEAAAVEVTCGIMEEEMGMKDEGYASVLFSGGVEHRSAQLWTSGSVLCLTRESDKTLANDVFGLG